MKLILVCILSYLIGSMPAAYIIGKIIYNKDIRKMGSGNVGTTNAFRNFGKFAGIATFLLDFMKGIVACSLGKMIAGDNGMYLAMFFVVIGHMFSFMLKFKAGKGVATIFGTLVYVDYKFAFTLLLIFLIIFMVSRIVSLASVCLCIIASFYGIYKFGVTNFTIVLILLSIVILIKHKDNIKRLLKGQEKRIF